MIIDGVKLSSDLLAVTTKIFHLRYRAKFWRKTYTIFVLKFTVVFYIKTECEVRSQIVRAFAIPEGPIFKILLPIFMILTGLFLALAALSTAWFLLYVGDTHEGLWFCDSQWTFEI